jgi:hypothetical protein
LALLYKSKSFLHHTCLFPSHQLVRRVLGDSKCQPCAWIELSTMCPVCTKGGCGQDWPPHIFDGRKGQTTSRDGLPHANYFNCTNQNAGLLELSTRSRVNVT